jgi:hypothetical protein
LIASVKRTNSSSLTGEFELREEMKLGKVIAVKGTPEGYLLQHDEVEQHQETMDVEKMWKERE